MMGANYGSPSPQGTTNLPFLDACDNATKKHIDPGWARTAYDAVSTSHFSPPESLDDSREHSMRKLNQIPTPPDDMSPRQSPVGGHPLLPTAYVYHQAINSITHTTQSNKMQPNHLQPHYMQPNHVQPRQIQPNHVQPHHIQSNHVQPHHIQPYHIQPDQLHLTTTWELMPSMTAPVAHLPQQTVPMAPPTPPSEDVPAPPPHSENKPKRKRGSRETPSPKSLQTAADATSPTASKKKARGRPRSQPPPQDTMAIESVRQTHLEKNRMAAHKCRQRKKEYVQTLEARARDASTTNRQLRMTVAALKEEVLELKNEVLNHATCGFWGIDQYLTQRTGDLVGSSFGKPKDGSIDAPGDEQDFETSREELEASILKTEENSPTLDDTVFDEFGFYGEDEDNLDLDNENGG